MGEVLVIKLTPKVKDAVWYEARAYEAHLLRTEAMFRAYHHTDGRWLPSNPQPFAEEIKRVVMTAMPTWLETGYRLQYGTTCMPPYGWRWTWTYDPYHNFFRRTK